MRCSLLPCALAALSSVLLASDEKGAASTPTPAFSGEEGTPALFSWADFDGDARLDLVAVTGEGALQLLANVAEDRFEDVTERAGLSGIENAALALWADYDGDLWLDLFVGASEGGSRLFRNEGGVFVDMSAGSGLQIEGMVRSAHWLDHDGDGRPDLHVVTAEKSELFRGLEGGFFAATELPPFPSSATGSALPSDQVTARPLDVPPPVPAPSGEDDPGGRKRGGSAPAEDVPARRVPFGPTPPGVESMTVIELPTTCASRVRDQANPGMCMQASTTPTLGFLYPLSTNLFVALSGNVGIGTTSPTAKLHVAGTTRVSDTLTLAPSGDQALNVSTGSIYKGGVLFIHTKGGSSNTAIGQTALTSVTAGFSNTATGAFALEDLTFGSLNTASGFSALRNNTSGVSNTAIGGEALAANTVGAWNTASGIAALHSNVSGNQNTASGNIALYNNTTGNDNTASGSSALALNTVGAQNTACGSHALFGNGAGNDNTASGHSALYSNSGSRNTASGRDALFSNTTASDNTASGYGALRFNTTGDSNTAGGVQALKSNTTGFRNTASGSQALFSNTTGVRNTASGAHALFSSTTGGYNTAIGAYALNNNTTGARNIALGRDAGNNLTTGNDNITIGNNGVAAEGATIRIGTAGTHTRSFLAGVRGVTTGSADAIPVVVDSAGQLGTVSSSRRFKKDIADMGPATQRLLELRPVVFRYKEQQEVQDGELPLEYGLIAEEVAEIFPDLVVYDEEGVPFTVKYHLLSSMLLNELQRLDAVHAHEIEELRSEFGARLAVLESRASLATLPTVSPAATR